MYYDESTHVECGVNFKRGTHNLILFKKLDVHDGAKDANEANDSHYHNNLVCHYPRVQCNQGPSRTDNSKAHVPSRHAIQHLVCARKVGVNASKLPHKQMRRHSDGRHVRTFCPLRTMVSR
jgi:hypothetical protein